MGRRKKDRAAKHRKPKKTVEEVEEVETKDQHETKEQHSYLRATGTLHSQPRALDVKIGGFTMGAYGRDLIKDTQIEFTIGRRYGLLGANGSGKSSFLRCMAARLVPIPEHIDIFLLSEEAAPSTMTGVEMVVDKLFSEVKRLEAEVENVIETLGPDSDEVLDLYERLDDMQPETANARARSLLHGLGFSEEMMGKATKDMSGGWRMRVALAQALFVKPTLLLLDEPTNHLDLEAVVWLERYLAGYDRCLVVVSHSQDFLNNVCTNIMELTTTQTLKNYTGNYDTYVKTKKELEVNQMKQYRKEQDDIKSIKAFIASCGTFANLVKQAKSKQKILDKMYARGLTPAVVPGPSYNFRFSPCEKLSPPCLAFNNVAFAYSGEMKDALYTGVNLGIDMDSRVAIVGPNGAGKSTLLKLMVGDIHPTQGEVKRHLHLQFERYHQHSADQLDESMNPLDFMARKFPEMKYEETQWRSQIGRFGVTGKNQTALMSTLSDGIKSRLVFAMMATKNPNLLLLDEPTNHLDIECIDALAEAINKFQGGMVLVSHDFRLIDQVAKQIWVVDDKSVSTWNRSIRSYKEHLAKKIDS